MRYFDYNQGEVNTGKKIPYDTEPIARNMSSGRQSVRGYAPSRLMTIMLVVIIGFNIMLAYLVFRLSVNIANQKEPVDITYIINGEDVDTTYVASKALPSAVCIASGYNSTVNESNINYKNFQSLSDRGAGVITKIDKNSGDATIVTCEHVVSGNQDSIYILLSDSYVPIKATYLGGIREKDIAVLKIYGSDELKKSTAQECEVADSSYITYGNMVMAIGNPMSSGFDTSAGQIRKPQTLVNVTNIGLERVIATDVAINSGNSGGGLFNAKGELVGIVNAKIENVSIDNYSYAIPSNLALSIAESIEHNGGVAKKAVLGLEFLVSEEGRQQQVVGGNIIYRDTVVAENIQEGSAAEKAGIKDKDIILGFTYHNTKTVEMLSMYTFEDHAYRINVGDKVIFQIKRDGSVINVEVEILKVS